MVRLVLLGSLAAVLLVGCGSDYGDDNAADDPTTLAPDTPVTSPPNDPDATVPPGGPQRVEPGGAGVDTVPLSFDPAEAEATDGGVLVRFYAGVEPCFSFHSYEVDEAADAVTVRLYAGVIETLVACPEIAKQYEVLVPLEAPLGDRTLVDGNA